MTNRWSEGPREERRTWDVRLWVLRDEHEQPIAEMRCFMPFNRNMPGLWVLQWVKVSASGNTRYEASFTPKRDPRALDWMHLEEGLGAVRTLMDRERDEAERLAKTLKTDIDTFVSGTIAWLDRNKRAS